MSFEFRKTVAFEYQRTVRLADTDAAGVTYFANVLTFCHEAYEASLEAIGIDVRSFFAQSSVSVPIVYAEIDFRRPLYSGDVVVIQLSPQALDSHSFETTYRLSTQDGRLVATALTRHVCLELATRQRCALLPELTHWLQQFSEVTHAIISQSPDDVVYPEQNGHRLPA
ncbi:MAG: acyl-CoA thioesterase [Leptolyngbyaceae cyanobacterium T60_A2020_046]|nr:acyl-CoA thioesterase [Leptolyngbyaceae cyanobacterium T60_A2020_046]